MQGDLRQARELLAEMLVLTRRLGSGAALAYTLEGYAMLAAAANRPAQAVRLAGAATALRDSLQHPNFAGGARSPGALAGVGASACGKMGRCAPGWLGRRPRPSRRSCALAVLIPTTEPHAQVAGRHERSARTIIVGPPSIT